MCIIATRRTRNTTRGARHPNVFFLLRIFQQAQESVRSRCSKRVEDRRRRIGVGADRHEEQRRQRHQEQRLGQRADASQPGPALLHNGIAHPTRLGRHRSRRFLRGADLLRLHQYVRLVARAADALRRFPQRWRTAARLSGYDRQVHATKEEASILSAAVRTHERMMSVISLLRARGVAGLYVELG